MIENAIRARLPLIGAYTSDTVNVAHVLKAYSGATFNCWSAKSKASYTALGKGASWYAFINEGDTVDMEKVYQLLSENAGCMVLINPPPHPLVVNTGTLPTPRVLVENMLSEVVGEDELSSVINALGGLTLKEISEVAGMASHMYGEVTPESLIKVRKVMAPSTSGLYPVDTSYDYFMVPEDLSDWIELNRPFFINPVEPRLVPRGLLMLGPPGTGKTMAAKHLSHKLEVPLYRLDLGSLMGKYVGESEGNLSNALGTVDRMAPCIMLIDEIEKLFKNSDDGGVVRRLLSQLLWWLQEHQSVVLTVMTTNDSSGIPPELYRRQRVDKNIEFMPLSSLQEIRTLVLETIKATMGTTSLGKVGKKGLAELTSAIMENISSKEDSGGDGVSHSVVVSTTYTEIKRWLLTKS